MIQLVHFTKAEIFTANKSLLSSFLSASSFPLDVMSVCLSVCISAAPTGNFTKICRENPNEVDIEQQCRTLRVKTSVRCIVAGENNRHKNALFGWKLSGC